MKVGVIGGGPAGMSASLWLKQLGFEVLLIDRGPALGGLQCFNFLPNQWVLGHMDKNGPVLAETFAEHVRAMGIKPKLLTEVLGIAEDNEAGFSLTCASPEEESQHSVFALVLAQGTRIRSPEMWASCPEINIKHLQPGQLFWGPQAFENLERYAGQRLLIIGAGDNAHEFIQLTAEGVASYVMLARSTRRAQQRFVTAVDKLIETKRCQVYEYAQLVALDQIGAQLSARYRTPSGTYEVRIDAVILLAGYEPESSRLEGMLSPVLNASIKRDNMGYLVVDPSGRTTRHGIYAAGDIINPVLPCVITAAATGAVAARTIEQDFSYLAHSK